MVKAGPMSSVASVVFLETDSVVGVWQVEAFEGGLSETFGNSAVVLLSMDRDKRHAVART